MAQIWSLNGGLSMDATKRKALHAAGWKTDDAAGVREMRDGNRQLPGVRVSSALAIR